MSVTKKILIAMIVALPMLTACKKEGEAKVEAAAVEIVAPTTEDDAAWTDYVRKVVTPHAEGLDGAPFVYMLPGASTPDYKAVTERLSIEAQNAVARGVIPGNMLVFASPNSPAMAALAADALSYAAPGSMKGSFVMFIGKAADQAVVKAASDKAGAEFKFVEVK